MARILLASRFTWQSIKVSSLPHPRRESTEPVCRVRPCSTTTAEECCCSSLAPVWPASLPSWTTCSCEHLLTSHLTHRQHQWRHSASLCQTTDHVRCQQRLKPTVQLQNCPISLTNRLFLWIPRLRYSYFGIRRRSYHSFICPVSGRLARYACHGCNQLGTLVYLALKPKLKLYF